MKAQTKILIVALLIVLVLSVTQSQAQNQNTGRYIVTIRGPVGNAVQRTGGQIIHQYSIIPAIAIEVPNAALAGLARNPNVVRIEPDAIATALPNTNKTPPGLAKKPAPEPPTPSEVLPWGVDRIDAESAWDTDITGLGVKVAVIDTGIDLTHPDLKANIKGGINCIRPTRSATDDNGHGTHVAGIIAAVDNTIGVVGVAPEAYLYSVKVLNSAGSGYYSDIIEGINWCADNGIQIANMSLGGSADVQALEDACIAAQQAGVIIVAAAGNEGGAVIYPAAYPSVIAVAATDNLDNVPDWSNFGPAIDIAAPGVAIYSTYKGGTYKTLSGTSMASPHVAGTLALVLASDYVGNIFTTADDIGYGTDDVGSGLVDAQEAATGSASGNDLPY